MKNNMSPLKHRTWFPFILLGLTVALTAVIWAWASSEPDQSPQAVIEDQEMPTSVEYQAEVRTIVETYLRDANAQTAYDALLDMWVPTDAKGVHLDLVIAFGKLVAGEEEGALLLETVRSAHDWLP